MEPKDDEETMRQRRAAVKLAREAASRGDLLAGMLSELERLAVPYYLGIDGDVDDSDVDIFP